MRDNFFSFSLLHFAELVYFLDMGKRIVLIVLLVFVAGTLLGHTIAAKQFEGRVHGIKSQAVWQKKQMLANKEAQIKRLTAQYVAASQKVSCYEESGKIVNGQCVGRVVKILTQEETKNFFYTECPKSGGHIGVKNGVPACIWD